MILAGDIGGTKVRLGLFEPSGSDLKQLRDVTFVSKDHPSLESILQAFLAGAAKPPMRAACFGVAGPVIDGRCHTTNLPWTLDEAALAQSIGVARAKLLNDVEAAAYGMLHLRPDEVRVLSPGKEPSRQGNIAVVSVGTGLGEGMLHWDGSAHHPIASEGGHTDFAPRTEEEIQLLRYLRQRFGGHVSYERVLSGPGLFNIYTFLRDTGPDEEPAWLAKRLQHGDPNATITAVGLAGEAPLCAQTLRLFCAILGAEAGNLALKCLAYGGVYLTGGIPPKIVPALESGSFMAGFTDKGRFAELMRNLPVTVNLNPGAPLLGAAHYALRVRA